MSNDFQLSMYAQLNEMNLLVTEIQRRAVGLMHVLQQTMTEDQLKEVGQHRVISVTDSLTARMIQALEDGTSPVGEAMRKLYQATTQELTPASAGRRVGHMTPAAQAALHRDAISMAQIAKEVTEDPPFPGRPSSEGLDMAALAEQAIAKAAGNLSPDVQAASKNLKDALHDLTQSLVRNRMGDKAADQYGQAASRSAQLTAQAAEDFPQLKSAPENDRPQLAEAPSSRAAERIARTGGRSNDPLVQAKIHLENLYSQGGVLSRWFSPKVHAGFTGKLEPKFNENYYSSSLTNVLGKRLLEWPEGFYQNQDMGTLQYLGRTEHYSFSIEFGLLVLEGPGRLEALKVVFPSDVNQRILPLTALDPELLDKVMSTLSVYFATKV